MNKIVIDEKTCLKHKLTLEEFLVALMYRQVREPAEVSTNLLNREVLVAKDGRFWVTQHWSEIIDEIIADCTAPQDEKRLEDLAKKMRDLYPAGSIIDKRTGRPTSYYFKTGPKEVARRLKTFFVRYGDYSDEDILDATKRYVASFNGNYQQKGFRLLKYFIFKDDVKMGADGNYVEPISPLYDVLENKESDSVSVNSEEWTYTVV